MELDNLVICVFISTMSFGMFVSFVTVCSNRSSFSSDDRFFRSRIWSVVGLMLPFGNSSAMVSLLLLFLFCGPFSFLFVL